MSLLNHLPIGTGKLRSRLPGLGEWLFATPPTNNKNILNRFKDDRVNLPEYTAAGAL